jgi:hypothetical protein
VLGGFDDATVVDVEVNPRRCSFGLRESDFALQALTEGRAAKTEHVRVVALRWHSCGSEVRIGLPVGL